MTLPAVVPEIAPDPVVAGLGGHLSAAVDGLLRHGGHLLAELPSFDLLTPPIRTMIARGQRVLVATTDPGRHESLRDDGAIVASYAELFAHLRLREATGRYLVLPAFDVCILEDAHLATDLAREAFGFRLTAALVHAASRRLEEAGDRELQDELDGEATSFFRRLGHYARTDDYRVRLRRRHAISADDLLAALSRAVRVYDRAAATLDDATELRRAQRSCTTIGEQVAAAMALVDQSVAYWVDRDGGRAALCGRPVDVGPRLRRLLFGSTWSVIATSSALTIGGRFDFVRRQLGVPPEARELSLASPFDHERNALLVVPEDVPEPEEPGFTDAIAPCVAELRDPVAARACVVLDRLPFPNPDDPVVDAIRERDHHWFRNYGLPKAILAFKEAFGHLIRSPDDRGAFVVLDRRLVTKPYGPAFLANLPTMRTSTTLADVPAFLARE